MPNSEWYWEKSMSYMYWEHDKPSMNISDYHSDSYSSLSYKLYNL